MSEQQPCAVPALAAVEEFPASHAVPNIPPPETRFPRACNDEQPPREFGWVMEAFHRVTGLILFLVTLPIYPLIWLLIKTDDGGCLFYRGERLGKDKRPFTITKFRTLRENSEDKLNGRLLPMVNGFETRIGRFLRETRIDEIPQFWNVAKGDMSIVGPRPELPSIVEKYEPWQHQRHAVRPGLTGLWQVSARGVVPMHEATDLDITYVDNVTMWDDFRIVLATPAAAFGSNRGH